MKRALLPLAVLGFLAVSAPAMAVPSRVVFGFTGTVAVELVIDDVTYEASDTGWYSALGVHDSANPNYFVGLCDDDCLPVGEFRDFAVFELGEFSGGATSAVLRLFNPVGGYISTNPSELYSLYDVSTGFADLTSSWAEGSDGIDIFDDLGSGVLFGSRTVLSSETGVYIEIALNPAGLDSLNRSVGSWAVGGALDLSEPPAPEPIPEPSTLLLLGSGLVAARRLRRRS